MQLRITMSVSPLKMRELSSTEKKQPKVYSLKCTCFIPKANELVLLAHDVYRFMSFLLCSKNSLVSSSPSEQPFSGCKNDLLPSLLSTQFCRRFCFSLLLLIGSCTIGYWGCHDLHYLPQSFCVFAVGPKPDEGGVFGLG